MMQMPGWEHLEGEIYVWQHSLNRMFLIILLWSLDLFFDPPATDLYENIKKVISRYKTTQLKPYVLDHLAVKSRLLIHIKSWVLGKALGSILQLGVSSPYWEIHIEDSRAEYVEGVLSMTENWRQTFFRWFRFRKLKDNIA